MKLPWRTQQVTAENTKSTVPPDFAGNKHSSFVGWLQRNDNWNLSFAALLHYYERCAPLNSATNEISDGGSEIPARVWDKKAKKYIEDHDVLERLERPNNDMDQNEFVQHALALQAITNNPFFDFIGNVNKPPLEIDIVSPCIVDVEPDSVGDVGTIRVMSEFGKRLYKQENIKGRVIYSMGSEREIVHLKGFNPKRGTRNFFATPVARPLYYDIEQYIQGGLHNKSLLEKGARPSGILTTNADEWMPDNVFQRLEEELKKFLTGAGNAGQVMIGENAGFKELSTTNKDMDYKTLIITATIAIYRQFRIPIPLVSEGAMTYSNYGTANVALYDRAILPAVKKLYRKLGQALFPRYGESSRDLELVVDDQDIPALETRRIENTKSKSEIGVVEVNELRTDLGLEERPGGDVIPSINKNAPNSEEPKGSQNNAEEKEE